MKIDEVEIENELSEPSLILEDESVSTISH